MNRKKWPLVTRRTFEAERYRIRRSLIEHLRQNQRGLVVCLDFATLKHIAGIGPVIVLGDSTVIEDCTFTGPFQVK